VSRKFRSAHRPTWRGFTLLLLAAAAALCPAAAVRALGATQRPDPPTHLRAVNVARTALTLAWTRSTGPGRIVRYRIFQDEHRIGHTFGRARFAVSGLRCGRSYTFSVRAVDRRGRVSHAATRVLGTAACPIRDTEPPSAPADLAQSEPARTGIDLSWSPAVDNVRVAGYRVTQDGSQIARTAETSLSVGGLTCATSYVFTVVALDAAGNASSPASLTASTAACAPPAQCAGVAVVPGTDLEALVAAKPAGTVFCIAPGTYRVQSEIKARDGQQFIGTGPGVVITGGMQLSGFVHSGGLWTAAGTRTAAYAAGDGFSGYMHPQSPYANDVTFDGLPLEKVGVRLGGKVYGDPESAVGPGTYFVDYDAGTVVLGSDPAGHDVELGVAGDGFGSQAAGLVIRDLSLDLFTSGGIDMRGVAHGWTVENVDVTAAHDIGIKLLDGSTLEGGSIAWSGRYGLSAHGADVTIDGVDVSHSDAARYRDSTTGGCVAAGGSKFVRTVGLVLRNSTFHDNLCNGIWLDVDTYDSTVVGNSSMRNEKDGIRVEVSHMLAISDNTVSDNGGWGIYLSNAPDADVHGNTVANDKNGAIVLHWSGRTSPTSAYGSYATSDTDVHDNTMVLTAPGQSVGIFDATGTGYAYSAAAANRFYANHYVLPDAAASWFHLGGKLTWSAWRTAGMDTEYGLM
jgi:parallel beta-helix repeat protein